MSCRQLFSLLLSPLSPFFGLVNYALVLAAMWPTVHTLLPWAGAEQQAAAELCRGHSCRPWGHMGCGDGPGENRAFYFPLYAMNQSPPPSAPCPSLCPCPLHACVLCTQYYPNISLLCRQEMRSPFFLEPLRKSSRVIMVHYLLASVYLGSHYFHRTLEMRKNNPPLPRVHYLGLTTNAQMLHRVSVGTQSQQKLCRATQHSTSC